jgi:hypothetical protein
MEGGTNYGIGEHYRMGEVMGGGRWWYEREREKKKGCDLSEKLANAMCLIT